MLPPHSTILPTRRTRVVLSTCHLDHDPQNNAPGNLAALCQRCHLMHDTLKRVKRMTVTMRAKRVCGDELNGSADDLSKFFMKAIEKMMCPFRIILLNAEDLADRIRDIVHVLYIISTHRSLKVEVSKPKIRMVNCALVFLARSPPVSSH